MTHRIRTIVLAGVLLLSGLVLVAPGSSSTPGPAAEKRTQLAKLKQKVRRLDARVRALEDLVLDGTKGPGGTSAPGAAPAAGFPTATSAGTPSGWTPTRTITGAYTVRTAGAVVEDLRIRGDLVIAAPNVVVRRVEIIGGAIDNSPGSVCGNGLLIEDTTILASGPTTDDGVPAIGHGGYTARNVLIEGTPEGFRVGGLSMGCGAVAIHDSFVRVTSPTSCTDWHGDAIQGYDGPALKVRNTVLVIDERPDCGGTAPFFYPDSQGNTSVDVDGLLVVGGGYPFRLGTTGRVQNLNIATGWGYGPIEVRCALLTAWSARIVTVSPTGQPVAVRNLSCT